MKYWILFFTVMAIFIPNFVFSMPPQQGSLVQCHITGVIKSVELKERWEHPCVEEQRTATNPRPWICPSDATLAYPARVSLGVEIKSEKAAEEDSVLLGGWCNEVYPVGTIKTINIAADRVKSGDTFSVNQEIEGVVIRGLPPDQTWFRSYNLKKEEKQDE